MNRITSPELSRRAALGSAGLGLAFLAACALDKHDAPHINELPGPERLRAQTKSLEPTTYIKTYTVDASGRNGAFRTFAAAYAAIASDRQKRLGVAAPAQSNPWDWRRIEVTPGTYHESIKNLPSHTAVVGRGERPEDVHIIWDGADNTFESTGRSAYVRNVHLEHSGPQADAHPMRDSGPAGDIGLGPLQRRTVVFEKVRFTSARTASLGKCTNDMAPASGSSLTFHACVFNGPGQPQSINLITNNGASGIRSGSDSAPSTISFVGCTVISNHEQHPQSSLAENGTVQAAPFGAPDFSRGRGDRVVWVDGQWDVGRVGGVQALMVFPYISDKNLTKVARPRPSTHYYLVNSGHAAGLTTMKTEKVLPPTSVIPRDLNLPSVCLSDLERQFFGTQPSAHGETIGAENSSPGKARVKAGDVYWVALDLRGRSICAVSVSVGGKPAGTMGAMVALDDGGKPQTNGNGQTIGRSAKPGNTTAQLETRWFYPGQGALWVGITFDADGEVPGIEAQADRAFRASGGQTGQVPTPAALTPVAVGTLVPHVKIHSRLPDTMS